MEASIHYVSIDPGFPLIHACYKLDESTIVLIQISIRSKQGQSVIELFEMVRRKLDIGSEVKILFHFVTLWKNKDLMFDQDGFTPLSSF